MICGRIVLRIITKYIAYYHIAELYAHASIVSTYVGLERCVKYFIENAKITVMWLVLVFLLQLACNAFNGALSRWTRNWHHYFCPIFHHIFAVMGVAHFTYGAHFGLPSPNYVRRVLRFTYLGLLYLGSFMTAGFSLYGQILYSSRCKGFASCWCGCFVVI